MKERIKTITHQLKDKIISQFNDLKTRLLEDMPEAESSGNSSAETPPVTGNSPIAPAPQAWHPFGKGILWGMAFSFTATFSGAVGALLILISPLSPLVSGESNQTPWWQDPTRILVNQNWKSVLQYRISRPVNILVMGIDRVPPDDQMLVTDIFRGRSDTILLLRFDPSDQSLRVLSIPRDTRIESRELSLPKINQANVDGGAELTARLLSENLNNVPIDRYVRVTTDAFIELVDLVGGIEVYVPQPMRYEDQTQKLFIDLEEGWQTLSGEEAEQFARFRSDRNGDIGRVQRQQILLKALGEKLQTPAIIPQIPQILDLLQKYVDTNLSLEEMLALMNFGQQVEPDQIKMVLLPGRFSQANEYELSYWIMSRRERNEVMEKFFDQNPELQPWTPSNQLSHKNIRIAIQNATREPGLAEKVARYLQEQGYNNIFLMENYPRLLNKTEIIVQKGDFEAANLVQDLLEVGQLEATSTGNLESDLTIRVGKDWFDKHLAHSP